MSRQSVAKAHEKFSCAFAIFGDSWASSPLGTAYVNDTACWRVQKSQHGDMQGCGKRRIRKIAIAAVRDRGQFVLARPVTCRLP